MVNAIAEREAGTPDRSAIDTAFVTRPRNKIDPTPQSTLKEFLLNKDNRPTAQLPTNEVSEAFEKMRIMLPVYNQQGTIARTIRYILSLGIRPDQITVCSNSDDDSDRIICKFDGVELVRQQDVLSHVFDRDKLFELLHIESWGEIRGKGSTMLAGHIHDHLQGRHDPEQMVFQTDTDISNIGSGAGEWNPLTGFAWGMTQEPGAEVLKAAKNGRNNQPMHTFANVLPLLGQEGKHYQSAFGREPWLLTGEYGWRSNHTQHLRWATGYAVEMVLNMSQADLGLRRRGFAIPEPRQDGQNKLTKETVMYSDIQRAVAAIIRTNKRLHDLSIQEIDRVNGELEKAGPIYYCVEDDESAMVVPNRETSIHPSKIVPDLETLQREGILHHDL